MNKKNNKKYIGSAYDFKRRKNKHLNELRKNRHHSQVLQNSWNKNNENDFEFIIIEEVIDKNLLIEREQWWLDNTRPEYNICKIAGNCSGRKHSEESKRKISWFNSNKRIFTKETRDKISKSKKGVKRDPSKWVKLKPPKEVFEYDKNGKFITEWKSVTEISEFYNVSKSTINTAIYSGFLFSNEKRFSHNKLDFISEINMKSKEKKILQYDLNNNLIKEWDSINSAKEFFNVKSSSISNCLRGKTKTSIGFIWKYKNK